MLDTPNLRQSFELQSRPIADGYLLVVHPFFTQYSRSVGAINPFAMTPLGASTTVGGPSSVNPFIAAQPPRPSLNQISATNQMAGFQSGPVLPNPMMPSGEWLSVMWLKPEQAA